jgi:hypothetical protein
MVNNTFLLLRILKNKYKYDSNSNLSYIFCNKYLYRHLCLRTFLTVSGPFISDIICYILTFQAFLAAHLWSLPPIPVMPSKM